MPTLQSAGVNVTEVDLSGNVPSVSTTEAALAGVFRWGPVGERVLVDSEAKLVARFGKPTSHNPETFFTAANFLSYGNRLYISRAANTTGGTNNDVMSALANVGVVSPLILYNVKNLDYYNSLLANGALSSDTDVIYIAKYPGAMGSSLKVSVCDSANAWGQTLTLATNSMVNATASLVTANIGSNTITVSIYPANTTDAASYTGVNVIGNNVKNSMTLGDILQVGNSVNGRQFVKLASFGTLTNSFFTTTSTLTFSSGNTVVTLSGGTTANYVPGMTFSGSSVPVNTFIASVTNTTAFVITNLTTGIQSGTYTITTPALTFTANVNNLIRTKMAVADSAISRNWEYFGSFDRAPAVSNYLTNLAAVNPLAVNTAAQDELHVVVVDEDGLFSGVPGTILERFRSLSRTQGARSDEGGSVYYPDVINQSSQYIWWGNDRAGAISNTPINIASSTNQTPLTLSFVGGQDGLNEATMNVVSIYTAYDMFAQKDFDVSLIMTGKAVGGTIGQQLPNYIIDNIASTRQDCVLFVSPNYNSVVNNPYNELTDVLAFRDAITSTSYAVMDTGYKYQYDRYNDIYRWVPLNGDIAGLCARTDLIADPWVSPAGLNRGIIKNVVKLAYNPSQSERDALYKKDVNPVITISGTGPVLYGDKTLLGKPSAFDRINVRRLFLTIEKAIATASKYTLFEFNDAFTRAQFRNLVEPYLRDVQGRRGIFDFRVVCDESNNTGEVIDRNQFIADIYIKPARSINFIQLNFVAVRTGISFNEIIGLRT